MLGTSWGDDVRAVPLSFLDRWLRVPIGLALTYPKYPVRRERLQDCLEAVSSSAFPILRGRTHGHWIVLDGSQPPLLLPSAQQMHPRALRRHAVLVAVRDTETSTKLVVAWRHELTDLAGIYEFLRAAFRVYNGAPGPAARDGMQDGLSQALRAFPPGNLESASWPYSPASRRGFLRLWVKTFSDEPTLPVSIRFPREELMGRWLASRSGASLHDVIMAAMARLRARVLLQAKYPESAALEVSSVLNVRKILGLGADSLGNLMTSFSIAGPLKALAHDLDFGVLIDDCRAAKANMTRAVCVRQLHLAEERRATPLLHPSNGHHFTVTNWSSYDYRELHFDGISPIRAMPEPSLDSAFARRVLGPRTAFVGLEEDNPVVVTRVPERAHLGKLLEGLGPVELQLE